MSTSSLPVVLVTGATGSTGLEVVAALSSSRQFHVVAGVRDVKKAEGLIKQSNVSFVVLDDNPASAVTAFKGVQAAYFLTAPKVPVFTPWLQAAKAAGVKHIVYHSSIGASPTAPLSMAVEHFGHEEELKASGMRWTILQPTYFHQNLEKFHLPNITSQSMFVGSAGEGRFSSVDLRDVAAVALKIFSQPEAHDGETYLLTGDVTSEPAIAAELSAVAGRPIKYVSLSPEEHRQKAKGWGLPDWLVEDQLVLDMMKREGWTASLSPDLEKLLGRKGITIKQYIQDNANLWKKA